MHIEMMIKSIQSRLGLEPDGKAGPLTWTAVYGRIVGDAPPTEADPGALDERSARTVATLQPEVRPFAIALVERAAAQGIVIKVISGTRSYAEQDALFAQGRTAPGKIVTNARGGQSNHNFGIAFDIGVFDGRRYLDHSPSYKAVGAIGLGLGLEWGGNWNSFVDEPHFQLRPRWAKDMPERTMLAELDRRQAEHQALFS
ncbi:M15 family metallopeptidase [Massilia sp. HP4]|uniref:M15 family metallopeptidase n=1 Tax=Massilia sp. HP4 TaxID=2562316 RepID=UPI0010BF7FE9|nr:M15 family metallopeptidase [Massilia sp. HP4]